MNKALFLGNSFIGDSILNLALMRAIQSKHRHDEILFPVLKDPMYPIIEGHMVKEGESWLNYWFIVGDTLNALCDPDPRPTEEFRNGDIQFFYPKWIRGVYADKLHLIQEFASRVMELDIQTVYISHWSWGFMVLEECLRHSNIKIVGFTEHHGAISTVDYKGRVEYGKGVTCFEFIGDKLSRLFSGRRLDRGDFYLGRPQETPQNDYVLLFPSTRAQLPTIGNWHLDLEILLHMGQRTQVVMWKGDFRLDLYEQLAQVYSKYALKPDIIVIEDFGETIKLIHHAKLVITPDSGQFHVSWLLEKPTIVKFKEGILNDWFPSRVAAKTIGIYPIKQFSSIYVHDMTHHITQLLEGI